MERKVYVDIVRERDGGMVSDYVFRSDFGDCVYMYRVYEGFDVDLKGESDRLLSRDDFYSFRNRVFDVAFWFVRHSDEIEDKDRAMRDVRGSKLLYMGVPAESLGEM